MKANVLKSKRVLHDYTEKELADIVGISRYSYIKKENGIAEFNASQIASIMRALQLTPEEIVEIFLL